MSVYSTILLAVDLHPEHDDFIVKRAMEFAKECHAKLYILHVVEGIHAYGAAQGYEIILEVENQIQREAAKSLNELANKYNIPTDNQFIEKGVPKLVILAQAKKLHADLIIVGSHGKHGIRALLSSTADGVAHHALCDVLEIRAKSSK
jgi:universal stress protein A